MSYCTSNPAEPVTVKAKKNKRQAFTKAQLEQIFHSSFYLERQYKRYFEYWLPLLALFTGARISELCQLDLSDVKEENGIDYFDITEDEETGKRTKTEAGKRRVPIHSTLKALGLMEYIELMRSKGHTRLLPDVPKSTRRPGAKASNWFTKFRRSCGINEPGLTFHSFRHTAITQAVAADNNVGALQQVMGHKQNLGMTNNYLGMLELNKLAAVIESLEFGIDVSVLRDGWKEVKAD